jgi:hypothetical protein
VAAREFPPNTTYWPERELCNLIRNSLLSSIGCHTFIFYTRMHEIECNFGFYAVLTEFI